jgi:4-amino-4-deoxychorismate lyase
LELVALPAHWVNGRPGGHLSAADRGFAYGDGVFETFRCHAGRIHLWDYHYRRLRRGLAVLGINLEDAQVEEQLAIATGYLEQENVEHAAGRLAVSRGISGRGYAATSDHPTLVLQLSETTPWGEAGNPLELITCETTLADQPLLAGIKHSNRLEQVLAAQELHQRGADEGLQMNARDEFVCAVSSNVFIRVGEDLITPPVDRCGVAGTVRELVIQELAPAAGMAVRIEAVDAERLAQADELFLTNALAGIRSVSRCDQHRFTSQQSADNLRTRFIRRSESLEC